MNTILMSMTEWKAFSEACRVANVTPSSSLYWVWRLGESLKGKS